MPKTQPALVRFTKSLRSNQADPVAVWSGSCSRPKGSARLASRCRASSKRHTESGTIRSPRHQTWVKSEQYDIGATVDKSVADELGKLSAEQRKVATQRRWRRESGNWGIFTLSWMGTEFRARGHEAGRWGARGAVLEVLNVPPFLS